MSGLFQRKTIMNRIFTSDSLEILFSHRKQSFYKHQDLIWSREKLCGKLLFPRKDKAWR